MNWSKSEFTENDCRVEKALFWGVVDSVRRSWNQLPQMIIELYEQLKPIYERHGFALSSA
ncbi:hypothetical protein A3D11_02210 [Candidatus Peribacteria bacterium RIFCSPHIGHO2_02_FULL_49_16]|nr:MAG: hypothetical protein A2880_03670 [Candidatus Peribacteria bacterium RIFCSPHIGHO2_01_FULL_49_38]OGJ59940.1 MAG: hypothetical protein A3D11_02210 [Candidatus Peribacteria bacterium RIFCSPHIGHO2_02_FULL_49_16]